MLRNFKRYVPHSVKEMIKRLLDSGFFLGKPALRYLELHLTDHCNLDCKGCGHHSPLASPYYADIHQYEIDMRRLSQLFRNIRTIRLMGGEPLLHQDPAAFITVTRVVFPKSHIKFVTNGILLPKASVAFWDACRNTNTSINLSVYPPLKRVEELRALCRDERVNLSVTNIETFHAHRNLKGDSDKEKAFKLCRKRYFNPLLKDGRLYTCPMPAYIHYFNESFNYQIEADKGIDIHSQNISGSWILRELNKPIETCKWCAYDYVPYTWSRSNNLATDWDAAEQRKMI